MAAAAAAALLDELMGRNRNVLPNEKPKELNWEDPEVSFSSHNKKIQNLKVLASSLVLFLYVKFLRIVIAIRESK